MKIEWLITLLIRYKIKNLASEEQTCLFHLKRNNNIKLTWSELLNENNEVMLNASLKTRF